MVGKEESDPVVATLTELQCLIGEDRPVTPEESVITISIPDGLARPDTKTLLFGPQEAEALQRTKAVIERDLRFEHLGEQTADPLQQKLIRFASLCAIEPDQDQVVAFVAENEQTPEERVCFLGIEFLKVKEPFDLFGLRLLPTDHNEIPDSTSWFSVEPPVGAVIAVPVSGTQLALMKDRAAAVANRALRVLRVGLRENPYLNQLQFRFRLSESYSFGGHLAGWQTSTDARWELALDSELLEMVSAQTVSMLAQEPRNDLERHAARALSWIEDSMIEGDPLRSLLFLFFALEAMLGNRSEGLKAHGLAYRRALLSFAARETFADPNRAYLLYDEVRSAAVHGEEPPSVSEKDQLAFMWDIRLALGEYLELATREGFETRRRLLRYLREHPDGQRLDDWLTEVDEVTWSKFFSEDRP
jgi:hypothetical protein